VFNGPALTVSIAETHNAEIEAVGRWLAERAAEGVKPHEIGVFVRSAAELERARAAVVAAGLGYKVLDDGVETTSGHVSLSTMHLAKGLEFRTDVDAMYERVKAAGVAVDPPEDQRFGVRMLTVTDPEGYRWGFMRRLAALPG
jgi:hypothetical protein